jgi:aryl-alcohol dehydrogenase-like predicted oxidoreductase
MPARSHPTRRLGADGPVITTLGFGAWAIGGGDWAYGWGPQDDADSIAAIHRALGQGVGWIDTAAVYGLGHSEEVVRRALAGMADPPLVFTKCGMVWQDQADGVPRPNLKPDEIRRECDDSLRRLGVERIDLYQFHWPDPNTGTPVEESWGVMADLVKAGKVRWAGVSNFDVALLERCEPIHHVDSLQPMFNPVERRAAELLPWCARHGTGVIAYSPMMSGLLTERFSHERMAGLDPDDWRHGMPAVFAEPALSRNLALRDALADIGARHGAAPGEIAIAWVLAHEGVTGAIVGARTAEQVDGWIGASAVALGDDDLDAIAAAIETTGAGRGPARP